MFEHNDIFRDPEYRYHRILVLDEDFPPALRRLIGKVTGIILIIYTLVFILPYAYQRFFPQLLTSPVFQTAVKAVPLLEKIAPPPLLEVLRVPAYVPYLAGREVPLDPRLPRGNAFLLLVLISFVFIKLLGAYRNSFYCDVESMLERGETGSKTPYTSQNYEVCDIFFRTRYGDLTAAFVESAYGQKILERLGISLEDVEVYLKSRTAIVDFRTKTNDVCRMYTLRDLATLLITLDPDFYQFLFQIGIRERDLVGAVEWIERMIKRRKQRERFWGRIVLGQVPAFGADLAFGEAYVLGRYSRDISEQAVSGGSNFRFLYGSEEIKELEIVLSRSKEANAILVGEEGSGKMDVILDFARDIMNGHTHPALARKRVMALQAQTLIAQMTSKSELETEVLKVFRDAAKAGNIILVIEDFPGFLESARQLGADIMALIDPYLSGNTLQVIATADNARFHQMIEPNNAIMSRFEKVLLTEPGDDALIRILEDVAEATERRNRICLTYPAVVEIAKDAQAYFSDGVLPDKAIDLLTEIVPWAASRGLVLVKKLDVLEYVREKTQIPVGEITDDEREKLMGLEELLKGQVVGQEEALKIIADAMRRSRAGVRNEKRPIGAFLFLGPTGVGKTETAKALAQVFFGDEKTLQRLDMTEYQGEDALNRMIGSMDGQVGTLPIMLKEHQYGVILLDEFEKTNPKILDLFLQVFDEGIFHDAQGKKVNARNTIFIATSNAGSQLIRDAMAQGVDLASAKKEIVDRIIETGHYKPELINRFDGVILFHPLTREDYEKIAVQMLTKLKKRLFEQNIDLVINVPLIEAVLARGVDPEFGARPMSRAIQELVEQKVAEKIISGHVGTGSRVEFTAEDFV
jgi:ATP-dependent Clp protease ATP-binding subunit ClpC